MVRRCRVQFRTVAVWLVLALLLPVLTGQAPGNCGGPVAYGESVTQRLEEGSECVFTFDGSVGERVTIAMDRVDTTLDPYLELLDPGGTVVASDDDGGDENNALIRGWRLERDGTYTVVARSYQWGSGGRFRLGLSHQLSAILVLPISPNIQPNLPVLPLLTPAPPIPTPTPDPTPLPTPPACGGSLVYGQLEGGTISRLGESCSFTFDGRQGDRVTARLGKNAGELDAFLELRDPQQRVLISDDDGGGGTDSLIQEFRLPANGRYRLVAGAYQGNSTGDFTISLGKRVACGTDLPVAGDNVVYGRIASGEDVCPFFLPLSRPQDSRCGRNVTVSLNAMGEGLDPLLEVVGADGSVIAENDDRAADDRNSQVEFSVSGTGYHTILARSFGQSTGLFELVVEDELWCFVSGLDRPCGGPLVLGEPVRDTIPVAGSACEYEFEGRSGQTLSVLLERFGDSSNQLDPLLQLIAPNGRVEVEDDDGAGEGNSLLRAHQLQSSGTYALRAGAYNGNSTGAFRLVTSAGQFLPGDRVRNVYSGRVNLRLAAGHVDQPAYDVLTSVAPGGTMTVLGGPVEADELTWWQVLYTAQGKSTRGWIAETRATGQQILGLAE